MSEPELQNGRGFWVELVAGELATNAVVHTATGEKHGRMGASVTPLWSVSWTKASGRDGRRPSHTW